MGTIDFYRKVNETSNYDPRKRSLNHLHIKNGLAVQSPTIIGPFIEDQRIFNGFLLEKLSGGNETTLWTLMLELETYVSNVRFKLSVL